jgi:hypothetical protein
VTEADPRDIYRHPALVCRCHSASETPCEACDSEFDTDPDEAARVRELLDWPVGSTVYATPSEMRKALKKAREGRTW